MKRSIFTIVIAFVLCMITSGCSGSGEPLKGLADVYAEMAENEKKVTEAFEAVYKSDRSDQQQLQEKAVSLSDEMNVANERLAEKVVELAAKLKDTEINCTSSEAMGLSVEKAVFSTVNTRDKLCNIVISVFCSEPSLKPYCLMMDKDDNLLWKTPANYNDGTLAINFRITRDREKSQVYAKLNHILIVTEQEYAGNAAGCSSSVNQSVAIESEPVEPAYVGNDNASGIQSAGVFNVGDNLRSALESASNVAYEYNADSGIWATIGNVAIVIDEDQLTQQGVDFIATITSDIAPDIAFKPEYVKPDAKILSIEAL